MHHSISKKFLLAGLLLFISIMGIHAQNPGKEIARRYMLSDSSGIYTSACLLLYTDGSFINFGILDNKKTLDIFVWYKAGTWSLKEDKIECITNEKIMQEEEMKKIVKNSYKRHPKRVLIESYYEFVHETFVSGSLQVAPGTATDTEKQIGYLEITH